jgi:PAS domain S-box-containing protein
MLHLLPDYEMKGPLPYPDTATWTISVSVVIGALLALIMHAAFGAIPLWAPVAVLAIILLLLALHHRLRIGTKKTPLDAASDATAPLRQNGEQRLALVLEAGSLGFWDWHITAGRVEFGGRWAEMLGYPLDEIEPNISSWERLVHPEDMAIAQKALKKHFSGEAPEYACEHRLKKKDGTWLWVLDRGKVVERDAQGAPVRAIGIHADISESHAFREAEKLAAKRKDEFLATLAHELRNPLAPIRTGLQILKGNPNSEAASKAREMMERQLSHLVLLIDDLLDVSRITRGVLEMRHEKVLLQDAFNSAIESSCPVIDAAGHHLSVSIPEEPLVISGDPTRLSQILNNLLVNAARYTPPGGHIALSATRAGDEVVIQVKDDALGIPADMLEAVFDMFGQVNRSLSRAQGGLGIGLALVRNLVGLHGGTVHAESPGVGKGSTFVIRLPLAQATPTTTTDMSQETQPPKHDIESANILVVDDNPDGAESLALYLEMLGHKVAVAHDGATALASVTKKLPRKIFLDIGLPDISGYEVAQKIRQMPHGSEPYIVAVTGWGTEEDKRKSIEAGCNEHLTKPIDLADAERIIAA